MPLCSNRPEGFGPLSTHYTHILTSCFIDTILIPLCTWLYLIALLLLFEVFRIHNRAPQNKNPYHTHPSNPSTTRPEKAPAKETPAVVAPYEPSPRSTPKRTGTQLVLLLLYSLLLLAQICMCVLELTRLSLAHLGIGLLPFTIPSIILAWLLHLLSSSMHQSQRSLTLLTHRNIVGRTPRMRLVRWLNLALWMSLGLCNIVKIVAEAKEGAGARKGSKYPMSDEIVDGGVMVAVYVAIGILEIVT